MPPLNRGKSFTAVVGTIKTGVHHVQRIQSLGIGEDARVIPGALAQLTFFVLLGPGVSAVVGLKYAAVFGFDNGPHAVRIHRRYGNPNAADHALRQPWLAR